MIKTNKSNRRWKKRLTKRSISSYHRFGDGAPLLSPVSNRRKKRIRYIKEKVGKYNVPITIYPDHLATPKIFLSSNIWSGNQANIELLIIDKHYYCYLLQSISHPRRTYFGVTNNLRHRLRQHNGEISGGAKSTRSGKPWRMIAYISGFASRVEALKFEWRVHHPGVRWIGVSGRIKIINKVIIEKKWVMDASESLLVITWLGIP